MHIKTINVIVTIPSAGKDGENWIFLNWQFCEKWNLHLPYELTVLLLGCLSEKWNPMFIQKSIFDYSYQLYHSQNLKILKYPLICESLQTLVHLYRGIVKRKGLFVIIWVDIKGVVLCERSGYILFLKWQNCRVENGAVVSRS